MAGNVERRRLRLYLAMMLGDVLAILTAFLIAGIVYQGQFFEPRAMMEAQLLLPLFLTIGLYNRAYSMLALLDIRKTLLRMYAALLVSAALLNFVAFYAKFNAEFSRATFTIGLFLAGAFMTGVRLAMMQTIEARKDLPLVNILVIDDGGPPFHLADALHVSAGEHNLEPAIDDPHALDRLGNCLRNMDRVIVSCSPERRGHWAFSLKCMGVEGEVLSDTAHKIGALGVHHYDHINCSTLIVSAGPLGLRSRIIKRAFDLCVAGAALFLLSPLLVATAVAIRIEDGGPAFFRQRRLGRSNRFFTIYKFRTMGVENSDPDGDRSTARDDERVTRLGRFLRASSIDELPQLFNVLKGDMSIVGPRPHALGSLAGGRPFWEVDRRYWQRHALKPGLTGLAQVRGFRGATEQERDLTGRLQADLEYLHGWSLWRDLAIAIGTMRVLVHDRAY